MAKAKQRGSSASQRREEIKKQRLQRISSGQSTQTQARRSRRGRRTSTSIPWGLIVGVLLVLAAVIGIFIYVAQQSNSKSATPAQPTFNDANVVQMISNVSPSILAAVGTGGQQKILKPVQGNVPPLVGPTGKPEFFYAGAEYCPYCAAERWAVAVALSRFGTFSKLGETTSSATDVYPSTHTLTFYQSVYSSQYIDFVSVESLSNQPDGSGSYTVLQTPTAEQQKLIDTYDGPPYLSSAGSIPFIDIANQQLLQGANYSPGDLANLSWDDIAHELSNKDSTVAKDILGSANYLTAAICIVTKQQPASVCSAAPVPQIEQALGKAALNTQSRQTGLASGSFDMVERRQN